MTRIILLDSGPLGLITNPCASEENRECKAWIQTRLREGDRVMVPAISYYEIRRELLRGEKIKGLARLDGLKNAVGYIPLTSEALLRAAEFWAKSSAIVLVVMMYYKIPVHSKACHEGF